MQFYPLIQNSSHYFSRPKWIYHTQTLTSTEHHISSLHSHFWVQLSAGSPFLPPHKNWKILRFFIINTIRESGSTLYVGLQHAVPPTRVVESSSLVSVLFREPFSHPNISSLFCHLLSVLFTTPYRFYFGGR